MLRAAYARVIESSAAIVRCHLEESSNTRRSDAPPQPFYRSLMELRAKSGLGRSDRSVFLRGRALPDGHWTASVPGRDRRGDLPRDPGTPTSSQLQIRVKN